VNLQLVGSPGRLSALNNTATFETQQANATANYVYGSVGAERQTAVVSAITWFTRATLQLSNATLLPSEQMAFGGADSNRGFITSGVTRDNGFQLVNELRAPTLGKAVARNFGLDDEDYQIMPFLFIDYGHGWNRRANNGAAVAMTTVGPGLSLQLGRHTSLRATYGIPVQKMGPTGRELLSQFSAVTTF
jgi:hemolysin activation/secretion protein